MLCLSSANSSRARKLPAADGTLTTLTFAPPMPLTLNFSFGFVSCAGGACTTSSGLAGCIDFALRLSFAHGSSSSSSSSSSLLLLLLLLATSSTSLPPPPPNTSTLPLFFLFLIFFLFFLAVVPFFFFVNPASASHAFHCSLISSSSASFSSRSASSRSLIRASSSLHSRCSRRSRRSCLVCLCSLRFFSAGSLLTLDEPDFLEMPENGRARLTRAEKSDKRSPGRIFGIAVDVCGGAGGCDDVAIECCPGSELGFLLLPVLFDAIPPPLAIIVAPSRSPRFRLLLGFVPSSSRPDCDRVVVPDVDFWNWCIMRRKALGVSSSKAFWAGFFSLRFLLADSLKSALLSFAGRGFATFVGGRSKLALWVTIGIEG
ncbi:hypothetical protein ACKS0A_07197 [Histoplasma ohiense]